MFLGADFEFSFYAPENACPNSYAYAYDESSHTALWTCDSNLKAGKHSHEYYNLIFTHAVPQDYTLTFCP